MTEAPIEVVKYNPQWPELFAHEQKLIAEALAQWLVGVPEHIGSTAVPGLAAKPVIDIMAPVAALASSKAAIAAAERIGYVYFPYKAQFMHWFCKPSPEHRTHHLHLVPAGSRLWRERLAFRDALRKDAALRAEYQALKFSLAAEHRHDRETYTDAKSPFISRVVQGAIESGVSA
jgi:GrpB-like predicted nucleotidyltransferase (UPF0157 family)